MDFSKDDSNPRVHPATEELTVHASPVTRDTLTGLANISNISIIDISLSSGGFMGTSWNWSSATWEALNASAHLLTTSSSFYPSSSSSVASPFFAGASGPAGLPQIVLFSLLFLVVGTLGIVGNCLVVYAVVCDRKMRSSVTNLLITNLAIADLLIMVFGVPEIVLVMINKGWILSPYLCKVNRFVLVVSLYASVMTLISICVERYIGIIHPIRAHILCNRRRIAMVIGMLWPLSLLCGCPTLLFNHVQRHGDRATIAPTGQAAVGHTLAREPAPSGAAGGPGSPSLLPSVPYCVLLFPEQHQELYSLMFQYAELGLFYLGPMLVQIVLYAIVSRQLFMGSEKLHRRLTVLDENGLCKERSSEALQARKGVVKMLIMSVVVYFVSYSPKQVLLIYDTVNPSDFHENWTVHVFTMIVCYINSAANPILYSIFSQNFRKNFKMALMCSMRARGRRKERKKPEPRRHSTFSTSSRFGRIASLVPSANTDL